LGNISVLVSTVVGTVDSI